MLSYMAVRSKRNSREGDSKRGRTGGGGGGGGLSAEDIGMHHLFNDALPPV